MKHRVNVDAVDEQYKSLVKPEMTNEEIGQLGVAVLHYKIEVVKNRWYAWKIKVKRFFRKGSRI